MKKILQPIEFPNDFTDWKGEPIEDYIISSWADEIVSKMIKNPGESFIHIGSGNAIVIGMRETHAYLENKQVIRLIVAKDYYETETEID